MSQATSPLKAAAARALDLVMTDVKMTVRAKRLGGDFVVVDIAHLIKGDPPGVEPLRNVVYAPRLDLTAVTAQSEADVIRAAVIAQRQFYVDSGLTMPGTSALPLTAARTLGARETAPAPTAVKHEIVVTVAGLSDDANEAIAAMLAAATRYKLLALPEA